MAQTELLWALLDGHHPVQDLKEVDVAGVNWSARSLDGKTLMVSFINKVLCQPKSKFDAALKTIEWLVHSGASIEQKCTGGETDMFFYNGPGKHNSQVGVQRPQCHFICERMAAKAPWLAMLASRI